MKNEDKKPDWAEMAIRMNMILEKTKITPKQVAKLSGVSVRTVWKLKSGERTSKGTGMMVATALGLDPDWFFHGSGEAPCLVKLIDNFGEPEALSMNLGNENLEQAANRFHSTMESIRKRLERFECSLNYSEPEPMPGFESCVHGEEVLEVNRPLTLGELLDGLSHHFGEFAAIAVMNDLINRPMTEISIPEVGE